MAFIIIVSIYSALMLALAFGFARHEDIPDRSEDKLHSMTVVVAVRNEAETIPFLLHDLSQINYPKDKWEIIVADDHSTDGIHLPPDIRKITSVKPGKKSAITAAVSAASGELIVTTDADCRVPPNWLREINKSFRQPGIRMVVGGVRIEEQGSFFSRLQSIEFVSVIATGAATLGLGIPTMCNGANLAYSRQSFTEVGGYQDNENIPSGDDEFLMNKFHKKWKKSIAFLHSTQAVVSTAPSPTPGAFVQQRLRWAGKWQHNISVVTRVFAMVVWLFHLAFFLMPFAAAAGFLPWKLLFILAGAKIFVESLFLIPAANFLNVKWRWISFLALQFVYSFYVVAIGLASRFVAAKWKGRSVWKPDRYK